MKRFLVVLILMGLAFLGGYVPMYLKNRALQESAEQAQEQLRAAKLTGSLGLVLVEVEQTNYGRAKELSSKFFDDLRVAAAGATRPETRDRLQTILNRRDEITSDLTSLSPTVAAKLRGLFVELSGLSGRPPAAVQ